jgi:hypothetical protein
MGKGVGGDGGDGSAWSSTGSSASGGGAWSTGGASTGGAGGSVSAIGGAGGNLGQWGSGNGDDGIVTGQSYADASAAIDTTAFNQSIVMGANILGNAVDTTIVGGSMSSTYIGDDDMTS